VGESTQGGVVRARGASCDVVFRVLMGLYAARGRGKGGGGAIKRRGGWEEVDGRRPYRIPVGFKGWRPTLSTRKPPFHRYTAHQQILRRRRHFANWDM